MLFCNYVQNIVNTFNNRLLDYNPVLHFIKCYRTGKKQTTFTSYAFSMVL